MCKLVIFLLFFFFTVPVFAQTAIPQKEELMKATVVKIVEESEKPLDELGKGYVSAYQKVILKVLDGTDVSKELTIDHGDQFGITPSQKVRAGQTVILAKTESPDGGFQYQIIDKYRLNNIVFIAAIFFVLVIVLSRWKGVGSFLGMVLSVLVILKYIIPQILTGRDPLFISITGSIIILVSTIYLAHGFSKQTTVAVISTALTLLCTGLLSVVFVNMTSLTGIANEGASSLLLGPTAGINFKGLLLGGMIIGFLGVLDDVTTGMAAIVFELKKVNPRLKRKELISSSLNVGREHISSLVNTLVLAYAGASLPLFLYIVINAQGYPLWFIINSEFIAEEIVRTLVGSIGLLLAVPITSVLAAWATTNLADNRHHNK